MLVSHKKSIIEVWFFCSGHYNTCILCRVCVNVWTFFQYIKEALIKAMYKISKPPKRMVCMKHTTSGTSPKLFDKLVSDVYNVCSKNHVLCFSGNTSFWSERKICNILYVFIEIWVIYYLNSFMAISHRVSQEILKRLHIMFKCCINLLKNRYVFHVVVRIIEFGEK